jgi:hypothetical protein
MKSTHINRKRRAKHKKQPGIKLVAQSDLVQIEGRGGKINAT